MEKITVSSQAKKLFADSFICDLQLGFEPEIEVPYKWDIVNRYKNAGFTLLSLAIGTDVTSLERCVLFIAEFMGDLKSKSDKYLLATSISDIRKAKQEKKLALTLMIQGTNPLSKNMSMLDIFYAVGVRSMILCYNVQNPYGAGCAEPVDTGLSQLGKKLVKKMNDIGMLIDCSHTGYKTSLDAMQISTQPVIFSHSCVYGVNAHPRNLKDDQIEACARLGGVIGIDGIGILLGDELASPATYVKHIDYIVQKVGPQYVALGTDFVYFPDYIDEYLRRQSWMYSDNYLNTTTTKKTTWPCIEPEQAIEVTELLLQRGYKENDIQGILGENYLRVIEKVWK